MSFKKLWLPASVSIIFLILIGFVIFSFKYRMRETVGFGIAEDVEMLQKIFERIDDECGIIGFDYQKNPINFLTVKSFSSSEVGSMNLMYPERWQGPYVDDNPVMQNIEYQIVKTKKGYFITPGEGVKLPNGKIVGKDLILDENADILRMMVDKEALYYKNESLAAFLKLKKTETGRIKLKKRQTELPINFEYRG